MDDEFGEVPDFSELINQDRPPASGAARHDASRPVSHQPPRPRQSPAGSSRQPQKVAQPVPQALPSRSGRSAILVSMRQKGNPILDHVRAMPWEYADVPADYVLGTTTCALFLSLKYHRLHPEYIYSRMRLLGGKYRLRLILAMVDIPDHENSLRELAKTAVVNDFTLLLAWSAQEAGHYLELYKACENAAPTAIRTHAAQSYRESLEEFVTTPRTINKSDAASLISTFGSVRVAVNSRPEQLNTVPGWGEKKVKQWCGAVREDFRIRKQAARSSTKEPARARDNKEISHDEDLLEGFEASVEPDTGQQEEHAGNVAGETEEGLSEGISAALAKYRQQG